jgi:PAS domain S-box-containing protein
VVIGPEVYANVYYTPPGVVRSDQPAARLQRWTEALAERKRAETALRQAEEESRSIVEHAVEGIFQSTPDGRILAANPALARMLGYASPGALIAAVTDIAEQLHVNPQRRKEFGRRLQADGVVQGFEMQVRRQDGQPIWVSASARAVRDAQGTLRHYEGIMEDITARKQAEEALRQSREQLRALAAHLESVREEARSAQAQLVHDELGQGLAGLKIQLAQVAAQLTEDRPALRETVAETLALIDPMIHAARRISEELRPSLLDLLGLGAALEGLAREFQTRTGIGCRVSANVVTLPLDPAQATALFRICQESLANVAQHARATHAIIRVEEEAHHLILAIEDNGRGITDGEIASRASVGLIRMRERALFLGGELTVIGRAGQKTTVTLRMPLKRT